jgi:tetratricopeptide (TPR) repeat protein
MRISSNFDQLVNRITLKMVNTIRMNAINGYRKHSFLRKYALFGAGALLPGLIVFCTVMIQCRGRDGYDDTPATRVLRTITHAGYTIELFSTAKAQLHYALGRFFDQNEKKAALEVVIDAFPNARNVHAEAELELAYLALGRDYRYASLVQCRTAVSKYEAILSEFSDLPVICAKASWYIGWILADLLNEPDKAKRYFQIVVAKYPNITLNLKSTVPWLKLVLPETEKQPQAVYRPSEYYWSCLALLELVRIGKTDADKWSAFEKLYASHRSSQVTGYAMRLLLGGPLSLQRKTGPYAKQHLTDGLFSAPMAKEISELLKKAGLFDDPLPKRRALEEE